MRFCQNWLHQSILSSAAILKLLQPIKLTLVFHRENGWSVWISGPNGVLKAHVMRAAQQPRPKLSSWSWHPCQGFSRPNQGSPLANPAVKFLRCKSKRDWGRSSLLLTLPSLGVKSSNSFLRVSPGANPAYHHLLRLVSQSENRQFKIMRKPWELRNYKKPGNWQMRHRKELFLWFSWKSICAFAEVELVTATVKFSFHSKL